MSSTFSPDLRLELIAPGEQSGVWGNTTNNNIGTLLEQAIAGLVSVTTTASSQALTAYNGASDQSRYAAVDLNTSIGAPFNVYVPPVPKLYVFKNSSAYSASIYASTVTGNVTPAGSGFSLSAGATSFVRCDGTNIVDCISHISGSLDIDGSLNVDTNLTVTGTATGTTPTTGDNSTKFATTAFVQSVAGGSFPSGGIIMWKGSIATIPSGWYLCNGSNGTPDLRDRFIVGAGSTYAVGATGGSADAIIVSHSHGVSGGDHSHNINIGPTLSGGYGLSVAGGYQNRVVVAPPASSSVSTDSANANVSINSTGSSGTNANLPPYYALAYIMKA
jgi:hypothetical protein